MYDACAPGTGGASAAAAASSIRSRARAAKSGAARGFAATCALLRAGRRTRHRRFASSACCASRSTTSTTALNRRRARLTSATRCGRSGSRDARRHAGAALGGSWAAPRSRRRRQRRHASVLRALWALCEAEAAETGADCRWIERRLGSLAEREAAEAAPYDAIVVATGARVIELEELRGLRDLVTLCRGQNLLLENAGGLKTPLICGKYAVPVAAGAHVLAGATFEYDPPETVHRPADADTAAAAARRARAAAPALGSARIGATAGVRTRRARTGATCAVRTAGAPSGG